jgi:arginyl-tRNA synthetase
LPTYEAKELGIARVKYEKYSYDQSIVVAANEVNDYFKVVMKAMEKVFPDLAKKTVHISHGMLRLPSGKMSSRTGDVITTIDLLEDVKVQIKEKVKKDDRQLPDADNVIEQIAIGAIKYSILRQAPGHDVIFDFEKSISFLGDSGPYLQYAYARACSVLRKAESEKVEASTKSEPEEISNLEKTLVLFPETVSRAASLYAPQYLVTYLTLLASAFNAHYAKNIIVDAGSADSPYQVALTEKFVDIMKNGLWILGMSAPEKM